MSFSIRGRFREQVRFLRRQFLQDGGLPFQDVLSESAVAQALKALDVVWLDRIYSPLVTLWIFLGQVLSQDHSCRAAVTRGTCLLSGDRRLLPSQKATARRILCRGSTQNWAIIGSQRQERVALERSPSPDLRWLNGVDAGYRGEPTGLSATTATETGGRIPASAHRSVLFTLVWSGA